MNELDRMIWRKVLLEKNLDLTFHKEVKSKVPFIIKGIISFYLVILIQVLILIIGG